MTRINSLKDDMDQLLPRVNCSPKGSASPHWTLPLPTWITKLNTRFVDKVNKAGTYGVASAQTHWIRATAHGQAPLPLVSGC